MTSWGTRRFLPRETGIDATVNIRKLIQERIRRSSDGVQVDSDVNAVVAANVGERGATTHVSSTQSSTTSSAREQKDTR